MINRPAAVCAAVLLWQGAAARADNPVAGGKYLVTIGICTSCHLENFAGGRKTGGILSANITPDKETGIGAWTEARFIEPTRSGKRPDGRRLVGSKLTDVMDFDLHEQMTVEDLDALVSFLRWPKPVESK